MRHALFIMKPALILLFAAILLMFQTETRGTHRLDSLNRVYRFAKYDTTKVLTLIEIAQELGKNDPDTLSKLAVKAKKFSEKLDYQKGIGRAINALGTAWKMKDEYNKAKDFFLEAELILSKLNDLQGVAYSLNGQGSVFRYQGEFDSALICYEKSLEISSDIGYKAGIAMNLNGIGVVHDYLGNYERSKEHYHKSIGLYKELGDQVGIAICLGNIGVICQNMGEYDSALYHYLKSLAIYEREQDKHGIALTLGNIGIVYDSKGNYPLALEYYQKGLSQYQEINNNQGIALILGNIGIIHQNELNYKKALEYHIKSKIMYEKLGNKYGLTMCLTNIANAYLGLKKYSLALEHYKASLKLAKEIHNKFGEAICLEDIALLYMEKGEFQTASIYYQKSMVIMEELDDKEGQANCLNGLARTEIKRNNHKKSISYALNGLAIAQEINSPSEISNLSFTLYEAYKLNHEYENSLKYHEIYKQTTDSLYSIEKEKALANLEAKADLEIKEKEIMVLNKNKEMLETGRFFQQRIIYLTFGGLILVLLLTYFIYQSRQNERKAKEVIALQKKEVEGQKADIQLINDQLKKQTEQLVEANESKDKLFSIIGHDLRSPIGSLESILGLMNSGIISQQEFQNILPQLHKNVQNIQITLDNLLHWSLSQMSGLSFNPSQLSIQELANEQIGLFAQVSKAKNIQVASNIEPTLMAWSDKNHIRLVLRNLLNNALKFTYPGGKINIDAYQLDQQIVIKIQDTGIGMTREQIELLFDEHQNAPRRGTGGEPGTGLGLKLCEEVAKLNQGKLRVISEPGKGSTFSLYLPMAEKPMTTDLLV